MASLPESLELKPLDATDLPPAILVPAEGLSLGRDPSNNVVLSAQRFPHVSSHQPISVQTLPSGQISEIGYVIPVARLGDLWPPKNRPAKE